MTTSQPNDNDQTANKPDPQIAEGRPENRFDPRFYDAPGRDELGELLRTSLLGDLPVSYPLPGNRFPQSYDWRRPFETRPDLPTGHGAFQRLIDELDLDNGKPIVIDAELLRQALDNTDDTTILRSKAAAIANMGSILATGTDANTDWIESPPRTKPDLRLFQKYLSPRAMPEATDPEEHP